MRITPDLIRTQTKTKDANKIVHEMDAADYTILSENEATRLPTNGRSTSPDTCLASNNMALLSDLSVSTSLKRDHLPMLLLLSTPLHQRAASRVQHPNHVAANSLSPQVARKGSTLSGFVQRSRLEREVGRDLHSNKWEEV